MQILLIEKDLGDIQTIRDFLSEISGEACKLFYSQSVPGSLELLNREKIDAILIDLKTPLKTDSDTLLKIRDMFPSIPFVALTFFDDNEFDLASLGIDTRTLLYKHKLNGKILMKALHNAIEHKDLISQLQTQKIELERSNRDLEKFSYAVSHDLREPLRSISGFIQLLSKRYHGALDAKADHYIERLNAAAENMQVMITSVLEYSRISTHAEPFKLVDCNEILEHALGNLEVAINETGTRITHDNLPSVYADFLQLLRVFQNLIANSIKFSSKNKNIPVIHVGVAKKDGFYEFYVKDNGIGIDSKYFDRIFTIFQRLHKESEFPGYGVGLAMCKRIIERHGGSIRIESEQDKGAIFYFTIPVANRKENGQ
ncbi:MAG TPA: hypothetical protein DCZ94_13905 [Lentisphaeria bacterium]|nr:MAG: hypothetical protein A2X48_03725 [Lentisphaerae bacterium GWF2_49_21]HBC88039.1 hypothetical protein [Lentisphaeria bacterium]